LINTGFLEYIPDLKESRQSETLESDSLSLSSSNSLSEKEVKGGKTKITLDELSVSHISDWLFEKRSKGEYLNHDEHAILERFKDYCRSKGKKYSDYPAAYRNAFQWNNAKPTGQLNGNYTTGQYPTSISNTSSVNGAVGSRSVHQGSRAAGEYRDKVIADKIREREARRDTKLAEELDPQ